MYVCAYAEERTWTLALPTEHPRKEEDVLDNREIIPGIVRFWCCWLSVQLFAHMTKIKNWK